VIPPRRDGRQGLERTAAPRLRPPASPAGPCAPRAHTLRYPSRHGDATQPLAPRTGIAIQPQCPPPQGEGRVRLGREGPRRPVRRLGGGQRGVYGRCLASPRRETANLAPATGAGPRPRPANRRPRLRPARRVPPSGPRAERLSRSKRRSIPTARMHWPRTAGPTRRRMCPGPAGASGATHRARCSRVFRNAAVPPDGNRTAMGGAGACS
jgi:hypothetical protein